MNEPMAALLQEKQSAEPLPCELRPLQALAMWTDRFRKMVGSLGRHSPFGMIIAALGGRDERFSLPMSNDDRAPGH